MAVISVLIEKSDDRSNFALSIVERLEYDPNRSAKIARLFSLKSKEHFYIIAPEKLKEGFLVQKGVNSKYNLGNTLPLGEMPLGTLYPLHWYQS